MKLSHLNPELQKTFRFVPNPPVTTSLGRGIINRALRLMKTPTSFEGVTFRIEELANGQPAHVFIPTGGGNGAALLNIHGGGMVIGSAAQDDLHMAEVCRKLGITVISAEYRLAPAHPFPAPLDDCHFAWSWLVENAEVLGIDQHRIAIGGQSAGGGLAASLVQRLHDQTGPQPIAQWLFCPMLDDRTAANRDLDRVKHRLWNNKSNRAGWTSYLGYTPGTATPPPYAAPARRADLGGLPPAWIGAGDVELFFAEDQAYAEALSRAGVDTTFDSVAGAPHAFESLASKTQLAIDYKSRAHAWLAASLCVQPAVEH